MDENREVRAMYFSTLHLPPIPAVADAVDREDRKITNQGGVVSSHDFVAVLIEWMACMDNGTLNHARMLRQLEAQQNFYNELKQIDLTAPKETLHQTLYNFYCHHTLQWIHCYSQEKPVFFLPADYSVKGDKTHLLMCDYAKAHVHCITKGREELSMDPEKVSYLDLLYTLAEWEKKENYWQDEEEEIKEDTTQAKISEIEEEKCFSIQ